jgi:MOSC domain-containing protein YiiM
MSLMRKALLWASTNAWMRERATTTAFVRRSVVKFMPGERVEDAIEAAKALKPQGINTILTRLGENITTRGVDLLRLPVDTELRIGPSAIVRLTGLRNPCTQLDVFQSGLLSAVLDRTSEGDVVRKSGVMGVVVATGPVRAGDGVVVVRPAEPYRALERV